MSEFEPGHPFRSSRRLDSNTNTDPFRTKTDSDSNTRRLLPLDGLSRIRSVCDDQLCHLCTFRDTYYFRRPVYTSTVVVTHSRVRVCVQVTASYLVYGRVLPTRVGDALVTGRCYDVPVSSLGILWSEFFLHCLFNCFLQSSMYGISLYKVSISGPFTDVFL